MALGKNAIVVDTYVGRRVTVTGVAAQVLTDRTDVESTLVNRGTASIFLGGSGVTTAAGFELTVGAGVTARGVGLFAVAVGSERLDILEEQRA